MNILTTITALVAIYGAGLSTLLAIQQYRDRTPRITIKLTLGVAKPLPDSPARVYLLDGRSGNPQPRDLILTAINTGQQVVTLGALGVLPPNGDLFPLIPVTSSGEIPYRLPPDEACHAWWSAKDVARKLIAAGFKGTIPLGGYYADQRGRLYRARPITFNLDVWAADNLETG